MGTPILSTSELKPVPWTEGNSPAVAGGQLEGVASEWVMTDRTLHVLEIPYTVTDAHIEQGYSWSGITHLTALSLQPFH